MAAVVLLLALLGAGPARADDRVLRIQDGSEARSYPVGELVAAVGLRKLAVARDPHFGPNRVFEGFPLEPLLEHVGLADAPELLLVCADGYRIPFDRAGSKRSSLRGLLAIRDTALPPGGGSHWPPYRHGAEPIDFDPFYLVWVSEDADVDVGTEALPWPFQLTGIQRLDREAYFAPARPPADAGAGVRRGFELYTSHCGRCHLIRGVGGSVGPELDRPGSLSSLLPTAQLRDYVRHDGSRYPRSKMPDYSKLLRPEEIEQLVAYLQAMQRRP